MRRSIAATQHLTNRREGGDLNKIWNTFERVHELQGGLLTTKPISVGSRQFLGG